MNAEAWRPIAGFEGLYEVSDLGCIRSIRRGKVLQPRTVKKGYQIVTLQCAPIGTQRYVHQLVLEAFVGARPAGHEVRHAPNPARDDNRLTNLSWGTASENAIDRSRNGTHNGKLTLELARCAKAQLAAGVKGVMIATQLGVSPAAISAIRRGTSWSHA